MSSASAWHVLHRELHKGMRTVRCGRLHQQTQLNHLPRSPLHECFRPVPDRSLHGVAASVRHRLIEVLFITAVSCDCCGIHVALIVCRLLNVLPSGLRFIREKSCEVQNCDNAAPGRYYTKNVNRTRLVQGLCPTESCDPPPPGRYFVKGFATKPDGCPTAICNSSALPAVSRSVISIRIHTRIDSYLTRVALRATITDQTASHDRATIPLDTTTCRLHKASKAARRSEASARTP